MNQEHVGEEVPPFLFSWRAQRYYLPIAPLKYTSHLHCENNKKRFGKVHKIVRPPLTFVIIYYNNNVLTMLQSVKQIHFMTDSVCVIGQSTDFRFM